MSEEIKENVAQMDDDEKYLPKILGFPQFRHY